MKPHLYFMFKFIQEHVAHQNGIDNLMVKSKIKVQFNGLPSLYIFDPNADLLKIAQNDESVNNWITPLSMAGKELEVDPDAIPWE